MLILRVFFVGIFNDVSIVMVVFVVR